MIKLFLTGDNHFGRRYERYPAVKDLLIESRLQSFKKAVESANGFGADFFVVAGDLFDRISGITKEQVTAVTELLAGFDGTVLVLPGNHDYFSSDELLWKYFDEESALSGSDILLLNEYKPCEFIIREEKIAFYPAFCRSKHGDRNNLGWIRKLGLVGDETYRVGIAHGAIEGVTPDMQKKYFLMTRDELEELEMDAWLIGHTHVIYPSFMKDEEFSEVGRIFNAGTHEQMDLGTDTDGFCIALELEKSGKNSKVRAKKVRTGQIKFEDIRLELENAEGGALEKAFKDIEAGLTKNTVARIKITGAISAEEYNNRRDIYDKYAEKCLDCEIAEEELTELITREMIGREFAETSFAAKLLEALIDEPGEAQMVYELINREGRTY